MAVFKVNGCAHAAIVALATLAATAQGARAETTTLVCPAITPSWPTLEIDLNEAQGTATVNWDAWLGPGGKPFPARSDGSFAASFNSKSVTFDDNHNGYNHFEINRLTGTLVLHSSGAPWDQSPESDRVATQWGCHVGKKQF
jgi:hypothetical protein